MTRARDVANLIGSGNYSSTTFTATAGQTAFTISHTQGFVQVFMNGLLLDETADYTSNGSAVTLTSGAAAGDEIEVVAYNTFSVGDALPKSGGVMTGALTVDAAAATPLTVDRATSFGNIIDVQKDGASVGAVGSPYGGELYIQGTGANSSGLLFTSGNTIQPRKNSAADDGNIDIGASGNKFKDLYLGGGAYIGGTGAANKLEDYEEGTYTHTITGSSSGSWTVRSGYTSLAYTKIGRVVTVTGQIETLGTKTAAGNCQISLPFTCASGSQNGASAAFPLRNPGTSNPSTVYAFLSNNQSSFIIVSISDNGGLTILGSSHLDSGWEGKLSLTYFTDA